MSNYTDKVGNRLNALLEKNYDAEKGYKKAAENAKHIGLKNFFNKKAQERYDFGYELKTEIKSFGQPTEKDGSLTGKAHRAWMDVKAALSSDNDESMLEEAIRGEKAAIAEYEEVLGEVGLPLNTKNMLFNQKNHIQQELNTIKRLEDLK
ncbi:PA2169 family four-helix-bundle protein [Lacinutrix sp. WUR7]|uniref:ferritin-like domain-containing protein n=1 Tax=Lacinutrix sp. WUR7 TaxID=2653681 RepID=UPI00193CFE92|nr:PA2169 family four-helix-bundle protein [Lacinutrix sp. WUR7]QRM89787.1 PA2169 family four-helix-bundle protein [Lacinutrix sp. WUR7]